MADHPSNSVDHSGCAEPAWCDGSCATGGAHTSLSRRIGAQTVAFLDRHSAGGRTLVVIEQRHRDGDPRFEPAVITLPIETVRAACRELVALADSDATA